MSVIFHIDLDSYFVSAERIINPRLKNRPVVICRGTGKSIITAASYEAKKQGVKVGAPLYLAKQKEPNLIIVKPNHNLYIHYSTKVFQYIAKNYTNKIEIASIDECYLDATEMAKKYGGIIKAARHLQSHIQKDLSLPLSIGISNNKFVAKMSTQINKPFGITVTKPSDFINVFGNWPIEKYYGIGRGIAPKLKSIGIKTISDLAVAKSHNLKAYLGKNTEDYIARANGNGSDQIAAFPQNLKSVGNSITFEEIEMANEIEILEVLSNLSHLVAKRAQNHNVVGYVIAVALKIKASYKKGHHSKQKTLQVPIQKYDDIYSEACDLFKLLWNNESLKFLSVSISKLENVFETTYQMNLDEVSNQSKHEKIIQEVNHKFKNKVTYLGKEQLLKTNLHDEKVPQLEKDKYLDRK